MQAPLFIRRLTDEERTEIEAGRRSSEGFTVRRSQMFLLSVQEKTTTMIARIIGCNDQTVRNAIHDFHERGLAALHPKSSRPHTTYEAFDDQGRERLRALLHQSPRTFGKDTSIWTLDLAAEVSVSDGLVSRPIADGFFRNAVGQHSVGGQRLSNRIPSPTPDCVTTQHRRNGPDRSAEPRPAR